MTKYDSFISSQFKNDFCAYNKLMCKKMPSAAKCSGGCRSNFDDITVVVIMPAEFCLLKLIIEFENCILFVLKTTRNIVKR